MNGNEAASYRFNSFLLDVAERQLFHADAAVPLTPKVFDTLAYLVAHSGHLVLKEELMQAVWPDSFVDEVNIPRTIHTIRRALGEPEDGSKFIETVPTKGYRFIAAVQEVGRNRTDLPPIEPFAHNEPPGVPPISREQDGIGRTSGKGNKRARASMIVPAVALVLLAGAAVFIFRGNWSAKPSVRNSPPETVSGEALQNYTQGRFLVERRHTGDYEKALELFEKAIELDPNYSKAYAGKADVKVVLFWGSGKHEHISPARTAVNKAIELDPTNSYAHAVLCRILTTYDWNHSEAEKECRKAVELDPTDHEAQKELAFLLHSLGREAEAISAIDQAIAVAPTSFNKRSRGMILYQSGRYDEAIAQLKQVEETDSVYIESSRWLIRSYQMKREYPAAIARYLRLMEQSGAAPEDVAVVRGLEGNWEAVLKHMTESPNLRSLFRAGNYAQLGEKDKAFETLEEMASRRASFLVTIAREPTLEPLRDDPRFQDLLRRIGLK